MRSGVVVRERTTHIASHLGIELGREGLQVRQLFAEFDIRVVNIEQSLDEISADRLN